MCVGVDYGRQCLPYNISKIFACGIMTWILQVSRFGLPRAQYVGAFGGVGGAGD